MTRHAERQHRIIELTRQGLTTAVIADMLGISQRTVERARHDCGYAEEAAPPMTAEEKAEALARLNDGASYAEVARTLGRHALTIARHCPGYTWDRSQIAQAAAWGRAMARLERRSPWHQIA